MGKRERDCTRPVDAPSEVQVVDELAVVELAARKRFGPG